MQTILQASRPLFALTRDALPEVIVNGVAVFHDCQLDSAINDEVYETLVHARSLLKPWQFLSLELPFDAAPHWCICVASHSGEDEQVQALETLADKYDIALEWLQCPESLPMRPQEKPLQKQKIFHPCAGKHLAYLIAAKHFGYARDYLSNEHPLHLKLQKLLTAILPTENIRWATDSCGLPCAAITIGGHIKLWRDFMVSKSPAFQKLRSLLSHHPNLVGGAHRLDSQIMAIGKGELLAKEGADGLLVVQSLSQTCFIKLASGYDNKYLSWALKSLLERHQQRLDKPLQAILNFLPTRDAPGFGQQLENLL